MTFYIRLGTKVADIFATDLFLPATLVRKGNATDFDPVTGEVTEGSDRNIACRAVVGEVKSRASDGAITFQTAITLNVEPATGDTIRMGKTSYLVGEVSTTAPNGVGLAYTAMVSR